jgi:hypothetical protein
MGFYKTKIVKGRPYLYWRRSHREGSRVITQDTYIGPLTASLARSVATSSAINSSSVPAGWIFSPPSLSLQTDVTRWKVNPQAVKIHAARAFYLARCAGVPASAVPTIRVKLSILSPTCEAGVSRGWRRSGGYVVSVPLDCHPASFWRAYKRALALSVVEAISTHNPAAMKAVKAGFRSAHQLTQAGLVDIVRGAWFSLSADYQAERIVSAMGYVPRSAKGLTATLPRAGVRRTVHNELIATVEELLSVPNPTDLAGQYFNAYARAAVATNRFNKKVPIYKLWKFLARKKAGLKATGKMKILNADFRRHKLLFDILF